jgi:hypothetical protein
MLIEHGARIYYRMVAEVVARTCVEDCAAGYTG